MSDVEQGRRIDLGIPGNAEIRPKALDSQARRAARRVAKGLTLEGFPRY